MSVSRRPIPRRSVLAASGTAVLAAAAACSSGTSDSGTTPTASSPSAASPSAAPSTAASSAASTAATAPTGTPLASVADVQSAGSVVVQSADGPWLLTYSDGTVVAHTAVCTHQQCTVAASGMCPCHGSKFNVTTGAVINGPALQPLAEEQVTVSGGQVYPT